MNIHRYQPREAMDRDIKRHVVVEAQLTELELDIIAHCLCERIVAYGGQPLMNPVRIDVAREMFEQIDDLEPLTVVRAGRIADGLT